MKRQRRAGAGLALLAGALAAAGAAGGETIAVERLRSESAEGAALALGGTLVAALATEVDGALWLLVRPVGEPDGPRRLLRVALAPEPGATVVQEGIEGWTKTLAAVDLGSGPEMMVGGLGRLASLGALATPAAPGPELLEHPGFDLRSLDPGLLRAGVERSLAAAEVGQFRRWEGGGGGLRLAAEVALPFTAERTVSGLRLRGPRVAAVATAAQGARWVVGPVAVGRGRLRTLLLGAGGEPPVETWSALPGPETVEEAWAVTLDDEPTLVVRTQGAEALDLFERQRLRVLPLRADRTRAGVPPTLAVELDAKRWQPTGVVAGDTDGDGRDDLAAVFPEGMSGGDLVVQTWRGEGGGRLETRARRSDLDDSPAEWRLAAAATAEGGPALVLVWPERIELRALGGGGRRAIEPNPRFALPLAAPEDPRDEVTVTIEASRGAEIERRTEVEVLGVAELDGRPGSEVLVLVPAADGGDRLVLVRRRDGGD